MLQSGCAVSYNSWGNKIEKKKEEESVAMGETWKPRIWQAVQVMMIIMDWKSTPIHKVHLDHLVAIVCTTVKAQTDQ